ncbi:STAS domain-containing protein [Streptomyces sp. NPDC099050]|uniref:STAS domain-containing protein n=1 Tax=Streptomyces sp. NPDC099050 TaxID=3366100 RepID=UPI0038213A4B
MPVLPFKVTESGVLIIRLRADLDLSGRAAAASGIDGCLAAHRSAPVVLELSDAPLSGAAMSAVVRTHHMCRSADTPMAVVAARAETRRALNAGTGGPAVHPTRAAALDALSATPTEVATAA